MKNILFLGAGAFGFAMMSQINQEGNQLYAYDIDDTIMDTLASDGSHPYFFPGVDIPGVRVVRDPALVLPTIDIVVIALPVQHIAATIIQYKTVFKPDVLFLNLSKGIDIKTWKSVSQVLQDSIETSYTYAFLAGGMLAHDVIAGAPVGATLATTDVYAIDIVQELFQGSAIDIIPSPDVVGTEFASSLKNVMAIIIGYYQGRGKSVSSIARYFMTCIQEMQSLLVLVTGSTGEPLSYAFLGDMIATCFGESRNRLFGKMIGEGMSTQNALVLMNQQKKYVEGYYTLEAIYALIQEKTGFPLIKEIYALVYTDKVKNTDIV